MAIVEAGNGFSQAVTPLETWNRGIQLTADGFPKAKSGGITFDWDSITELAKDTYLPESLDENGDPRTDAVAIPAGEKVLRYGSVVRRRDSDGAYVLAASGDTLVRGKTYVVNQTVLKSDRYSAHPNVIEGGRIFGDRLIVGTTTAEFGTDVDGGSVTQTVPTLANLLAVCPLFSFAAD
jgi:hypothetical protein